MVQLDRQAELGGHLRGAFLQVGTAQIEPALQGRRVLVVGSGPAGRQGLGRGVHRELRRADAGAPGQEVADRLAGPPVALLRQVADVGGGRAQRHGAGLDRIQTGQGTQQRRLAGAVDAHQADHVTGGDHQVEFAEQGAFAVPRGEIAGDHRGAHRETSLSPVSPGYRHRGAAHAYPLVFARPHVSFLVTTPE
jgi:hypothetical protein